MFKLMKVQCVLLFLFISIVTLQVLPAQDISDGYRENWAPFYHGVASGDPLDRSVIIWTRVTPDRDESLDKIEVSWEMALDPGMVEVIRNGMTNAEFSKDYTVKLEIDGLEPQTTYYYHFTALGKNSLIGRTRTLPSDGMGMDHLKLGVLVCSNLQAGYFNIYRWMADQNDLDGILHLGDYIYEYESGGLADPNLVEVRPIFPETEALSLEDYRLRYATYRLDTNLIRMHQQYPIFAIWDDHDIANNAWKEGASNHDPQLEGDWHVRKQSAIQARNEWLPAREYENGDLYRSFNFGNLADLIILDTRHEGRDQQLTSVLDSTFEDPGRSIMSPIQKQWFKNEMQNSDAAWKIIGSQVLFSVFNSGWVTAFVPQIDYWQGESLFLDSWNGYPAEQADIMQFIADNEISNLVFATGDLHVSFAIELAPTPNGVALMDTLGRENIPFYHPSETYDPSSGENNIGVEFMTPSVTAPNFDEQFDVLTALLLNIYLRNEIILPDNITSIGNPNPHFKFADLTRHGGMILDIKPDSVQANWYFVPIDAPGQSAEFTKAFYTLNGENHLREAFLPGPAKDDQDERAPLEPLITSLEEIDKSSPLKGVSTIPNPFNNQFELKFDLDQRLEMEIQIRDIHGRLLYTHPKTLFLPGSHTEQIQFDQWEGGIYFIQFYSNSLFLDSYRIINQD